MAALRRACHASCHSPASPLVAQARTQTAARRAGRPQGTLNPSVADLPLTSLGYDNPLVDPAIQKPQVLRMTANGMSVRREAALSVTSPREGGLTSPREMRPSLAGVAEGVGAMAAQQQQLVERGSSRKLT